MSKELIEFLKSKMSDDDVATVIQMLNGGDPDDMGMDDPLYRGRDVLLPGGGTAQDAAIRQRVAADRNALEEQHGIAPSRIRNLG